MRDKRGLSEVVTAILIVLLAVAAVIIVWYVVRPMIERSGEQAEAQTECIGLDLSFVSAAKVANVISVTVRRGTDDITGNDLIVTATCADGNSKTPTAATEINSLETKSVQIDCGTSPGAGASTIVNLGLKTDKGTTCQGQQNKNFVFP